MRELFLQRGMVATISDVDYDRCRPFTWRADTNNASGKPYVRTDMKKPDGRYSTVYLHRFIVGGVIDLPETMKVDHRNTDTLINERPNLRVATHDQNNYNRCGFGLSGYKGVSRDGRRWRARITFKEVVTHLGLFSDPVEAAKAYDDAAVERFGEFAWLNFPENYPTPNHDIINPDIPF